MNGDCKMGAIMGEWSAGQLAIVGFLANPQFCILVIISAASVAKALFQDQPGYKDIPKFFLETQTFLIKREDC